ncbi:MAG: hypothetical protein HC906_01125 [Bacteroidales bacterium]|nr:hypothetical protein [Bacteroidales bacterium]
MAAIKFIVKSKEKGRLATVYLRFVDSKATDLMVSIPVKVYPEYWSNKTESFKQRILFDEVFTEQEKVNVETELRDLKNFVFNQFNDLCRTGATPSKEWLKM